MESLRGGIAVGGGSVCASVCVCPSLVRRCWSGAASLKSEVCSCCLGGRGGGEEMGVTPNPRHKLRNYFWNVPKSIFENGNGAKSVTKK